MIDDQIIRDAAQNARSVTEVMVRAGLKPNGFAHARFKKRLENLGIVFPVKPWNKGKFGPKKSIENYLVKNGPSITGSSLRKKLIRAGLKENECAICGLLPLWNNMKLNMHLDHIDGDKYNNEITNLRILCPNCHTQTPTYGKIKNVKIRKTIYKGKTILVLKRARKQYFCGKCNKELGQKRKTGFCFRCMPHSRPCNSRAQKRKVENRPLVGELLLLTKEHGFSAVGRMFNVTDNAVRKWMGLRK